MVPHRQVRRQQPDRGQGDRGLLEQLEDHRIAARGPRRLDAVVGRALGQMQHLRAVADIEPAQPSPRYRRRRSISISTRRSAAVARRSSVASWVAASSSDPIVNSRQSPLRSSSYPVVAHRISTAVVGPCAAIDDMEVAGLGPRTVRTSPAIVVDGCGIPYTGRDHWRGHLEILSRYFWSPRDRHLSMLIDRRSRHGLQAWAAAPLRAASFECQLVPERARVCDSRCHPSGKRVSSMASQDSWPALDSTDPLNP